MSKVEPWVAIALVALAVVPVTTLSQILTAWFARKLGVEPTDIREYDDAVNNGEQDSESES